MFEPGFYKIIKMNKMKFV